MAYSLDFRKKVFSIKEKENMTIEGVAKRFGIGVATVARWSKNIVPKKTRNKPPTKISTEALLKDLEQYPDAYYYERAERLGASKSGVWSAMKKLKITCKKKP